MVLQEIVEMQSGLGQSGPMLTVRVLDAAKKPYIGIVAVWISYEKRLTQTSQRFKAGENIVLPLETNLGRAIIDIWPQDEPISSTAYVVPRTLVVDPAEGSQTISFIIFKHRGEVEPLEVLGYSWITQITVGLGIGALLFGTAYGIHHYFVKGR